MIKHLNVLLKIYKNKPATLDIFICLFLIFSIVAVYYQVYSFEFINLDTAQYVYQNIHVKRGITLDNIIWAFSTTTASNWHPITWLSHMIDVELFGLNSGAHHAVNVLFHIINSLTLYWLIKKLSGSSWCSCFIASLFALHPLHVESVVWVAERKDVLSTMFGFFSIISYCYYTEKRERFYYLLVIMFFLLSLLSKPMLVTLPCILLLIDYWSLNRLTKYYYFSLLVEKIPLFVLSIASSVVTMYVQHSGGAMASTSFIPIYSRIFNAVNSYVKYVFFTFYPINLTIIYPYPKEISFYNTLFSTTILLLITCYSLLSIKKLPWLFVGWFFFLGTLLPVIGIIQVGLQAMGDRYTYVPLIGIFIIIANSIAGCLIYLTNQFGLKTISQKSLKWILVFSIILIFAIISYKQSGYWKNSISLFSRAIEITEDNYVAHNSLGSALLAKKRYREADEHFRTSINIMPYSELAYFNYGVSLGSQNNIEEAIKQYQIAIKLRPDLKYAYINIANLYYGMGNYSEAMKYYVDAYKIDNIDVKVINSIGVLMFKFGDIDKGISFFKRALEIDPDYSEARNNLKKIEFIKNKNTDY